MVSFTVLEFGARAYQPYEKRTLHFEVLHKTNNRSPRIHIDI